MINSPNIVWVNLDSIRADHTTMSGYSRETTPTLQRLANMGRGYTNCFSHGNWSLPSVASMLTGTYPFHHGLGPFNEVLPEELATVPELLSAAGYYTMGLSLNGYFNKTTGLNRGFDRFEWLNISNLVSGAGLRSALKYLLGIRRHSAGLTLRPTNKHTTDFLAADVGSRWLRQSVSREPFFLFIHAQAAHLPYYPPLPYHDQFTDDLSAPKAAQTVFKITSNYLKATADRCEFDDDTYAAIRAMYDAKIAYADDQVNRLFRTLQALDTDETVFIVTSDHGDLHGEYGILGHLLALHDGVTHVPLVIHAPEYMLDFFGDADSLIQHIDVMRTLLAMAGAETDQLHGHDLRREERPVVVSQRGPSYYDKRLAEIHEHDADYEPPTGHSGALTALRSEDYKYLSNGESQQLFALPDESTEVGAHYPDVVEQFKGHMCNLPTNANTALRTNHEKTLPDDVRQQLTDMGYLVE